MTAPKKPARRRLKSLAPWPVKIGVKLVIALLPVPHRVWKRLGIFEHSNRAPEAYVEKVLAHRRRLAREEDFTVLELGPGDSVASALVMAALGARKVYLSDVGPFADADPAAYVGVAEALRGMGLDPVDPRAFTSLEGLLAACRAEYLTGGPDDLARIPDGSVDLIWSHAVLEHVRGGDMTRLLAQLRRVQAPDGVSSHAIDLKDHLSDGLQSLRFPTRIWEPMAYAGFYTNRWRSSQLREAFVGAGFAIQEEHTARWDEVPLPRSRMAAEFRHHSDEDLKIHELALVLTPEPEAAAVS